MPQTRYTPPASGQKKELIRQFKALPTDRQQAIKLLLNKSCPYCEREFGTGNVGVNHSMCPRHRIEVYQQMMKKTPPPVDPNTLAQDLKDFTPEELKIASYFTALMYAKDRKAW